MLLASLDIFIFINSIDIPVQTEVVDSTFQGSMEMANKDFLLNPESGFSLLIQYLLPLSFLGEIEQQDQSDRTHFQF